MNLLKKSVMENFILCAVLLTDAFSYMCLGSFEMLSSHEISEICLEDSFNPLMHNVPKWSNTILKSCSKCWLVSVRVAYCYLVGRQSEHQENQMFLNFL